MSENEFNKGKLKFVDCFDLPNPGLRSFLDNVEKGQPEIYHTPWIKVPEDWPVERKNRSIMKQFQKIMSEWMPHLDKISTRWPSLYEFEKDLAAKNGPMSVMKPLEERLDDIEAYYKGILLPAEKLSDDAIAATIEKFKQAKGLMVRSQQRTLDLMKKSTNSGSPYFTRKRNVMAKTVPCTVSGSYQFLNGDHRFGSCAILGWRGQEGGPEPSDNKQRVVWMFPFAVNICELSMYQPLMECFQSFNLVPAWVSMESVDRSITRLFDTKSPDDLVVCTDFTKFDQHFNPALQEAAQSILRQLCRDTADNNRWLEEVFPIKYEIPLAYSFGKIRTGKHGMGSGSGGTNADETLAHTALQIEAAQRAKQTLNPNSMCLGDDGVLTYPGITSEDVVRSYTSHGLEMNPVKQYESKHDCVYLRRWHHQNYRVDGVCVGVYSTARALGRLCMQERFYDADEWSAKMVALRELSIIENCKYHPLKEEFAEFCMKRDKFRLGIDIPGFLDNIDKEAEKAIEHMPDFLGYTKSMVKDQTGLSNWWIVNYLKSKR
uniref:Putative RNA-dependent RNA polymerase n=1 Tax=Dromedary picobirnavirus TaxID=1574421 RepID=A0A0A1ENY2_9VIRU|nr:putative RNA-dependent RNA polymerase [Dromedary picobirnavirus]